MKVAQANLNRTQAGAKRGEIAAQKAAIASLEAQRQGDINAQAATIERFQAGVRNAQAEDERYQQLNQQGAISASQRDSKRLNLETVQNKPARSTGTFKSYPINQPATDQRSHSKT